MNLQNFIDLFRFTRIFMDCWLAGWLAGWLLAAGLAGLARLAGTQPLGFVGRRLGPCSLPGSTLGEVGRLTDE